eukprot:2014889-Pleurochrysis_carterae.AAC.1
MEYLPSTLQITYYCPRHQKRQRMPGAPSLRAGCKLLRAKRLPLGLNFAHLPRRRNICLAKYRSRCECA